MADLTFNHIYAGTASKSVDVEVLGETASNLENVHEKVVILLTAEELNSILTVTETEEDNTDSDAKAKPSLSFNLNVLGVMAKIKAAPVTAVNAVLASVNFSGTNSWLAAIPHEAIKSIEAGDPEWAYGEMFDEVTADAASTDAKPLAVQNLFEQVVAAGRLQTSNGQNTVFIAGDAITVYITYTVTKSRNYTMDGAAGTAMAKFTVGGTEYTLNAETSIDSYDNGLKKIAYQLTIGSTTSGTPPRDAGAGGDPPPTDPGTGGDPPPTDPPPTDPTGSSVP